MVTFSGSERAKSELKRERGVVLALLRQLKGVLGPKCVLGANSHRKGSPGAAKRRPRAAQRRPMSVPRAPQERPRAPQSVPRAPKSAQRAPQSAPRAPERTPRAAQERPESRPRAKVPKRRNPRKNNCFCDVFEGPGSFWGSIWVKNRSFGAVLEPIWRS